MITDIIESESYKELVVKQVYETLDYLLDTGLEFSITVNIDPISFTPKLPDAVYEQLQKYSLFSILRSNYALISFTLEHDYITFETGFGSENFGSVVKIPLHAIFQIVIDESILYVNTVATVDKFNEKKDDDLKEKSMNIFKKNLQNKKFD